MIKQTPVLTLEVRVSCRERPYGPVNVVAVLHADRPVLELLHRFEGGFPHPRIRVSLVKDVDSAIDLLRPGGNVVERLNGIRKRDLVSGQLTDRVVIAVRAGNGVLNGFLKLLRRSFE